MAMSWQSCFTQVANSTNRELMLDIYKVGIDLKRIKDIYSVDNVAFLLDSTLATECGSSSSSSSGSDEHQEHGVNPTLIWQYQLQLMAIFSSMMGAVKINPIQFNENAAWSCDVYTCRSCCSAFRLASGGFLLPFQTNQTACNDGLLEPACRLAYHDQESCSPAFVNIMAVAIINSNAHGHVHKKGNFGDYSPCHTHYKNRYAIGIHKANKDDLERFQSREGNHYYLPDDDYSMSMVDKLYTCIRLAACTALPVFAVDTSCSITAGHTGETIEVLTL